MTALTESAGPGPEGAEGREKEPARKEGKDRPNNHDQVKNCTFELDFEKFDFIKVYL